MLVICFNHYRIDSVFLVMINYYFQKWACPMLNNFLHGAVLNYSLVHYFVVIIVEKLSEDGWVIFAVKLFVGPIDKLPVLCINLAIQAVNLLKVGG